MEAEGRNYLHVGMVPTPKSSLLVIQVKPRSFDHRLDLLLCVEEGMTMGLQLPVGFELQKIRILTLNTRVQSTGAGMFSYRYMGQYSLCAYSIKLLQVKA